MLMLIGGGSGSTAGGIKVSTAFILFIVLFRGVNERGDIRFLRRRISSTDVSRAAMFFLKAISLLFVSILTLGIVEYLAAGIREYMHNRSNQASPFRIVILEVDELLNGQITLVNQKISVSGFLQKPLVRIGITRIDEFLSLPFRTVGHRPINRMNGGPRSDHDAVFLLDSLHFGIVKLGNLELAAG